MTHPNNQEPPTAAIVAQVEKVVARTPIIKTCEPLPVGTRGEGLLYPGLQDDDECDMRKVLAHLKYCEAVVAAARDYVAKRDVYKTEHNFGEDIERLKRAIRESEDATHALDAALKEPEETRPDASGK